MNHPNACSPWSLSLALASDTSNKLPNLHAGHHWALPAGTKHYGELNMQLVSGRMTATCLSKNNESWLTISVMIGGQNLRRQHEFSEILMPDRPWQFSLAISSPSLMRWDKHDSHFVDLGRDHDTWPKNWINCNSTLYGCHHIWYGGES
jgi:hypothetical protein